MRRDQFSLEAADVRWVEEGGEPREPSVAVDFEGEDGDLRDRLTGPDGDPLSAAETDVSLRLLGPVEDDPEGVVAVTNRVTGEFVLELNADAADVLDFVTAARRYGEHAGDDGSYRVEIRIDGEPFVTYEKSTFLVYNAEGELLRSRSLIPGGVEL